MKKYLIQIAIGICLYLLVPLISSNSNTNDTIKYLVGIIPVLYSLVLYTYYKPKYYLKFLSINSRNKDIGYLYKISIKDFTMSKDDFDNLKEALFHIQKNELIKPKMFSYDCGLYKYNTVFYNGLFNIEMDYSVDEKIFLFTCESNSTFWKLIKQLFLINEKLTQKLNSAVYDIKMYIEFLNDKSESRNPFVNNIFREFTNRDLSLKYVAKKGTKIEISNNKISFQSDNLIGINNDLIKEIKLLKRL